MPRNQHNEPPAMGERRARLGYGAQDRVAAGLILDALRSPGFHSVRLADLEGGQVDDFVLVWDDEVWGNSVKWTSTDDPLTWSDLCGAGEPLIRQLADGWKALLDRWPGRHVRVFLRTNRLPADSTHGNQLVPGVSLSRILHDDWSGWSRGGGECVPTDSPAWAKVLQASGLTAAEFREFVGDCDICTGQTLPFQGATETLDVLQWTREFNRLRQSINDLVADDQAQEEFTADEIRRAIETALHTRGLAQRFPEPEIGYQENSPAVTALRGALSRFSQGYVALTGPAGAGKSTLVQHVIADEPFGIPYFAFLPSGRGDPRERGDAIAFYRHLIAALDQWNPHARHSHGVADLAQAKEALRMHMAGVRERYDRTGRPTVVLVDGLDHVTREEGLDRPLQLELPLPEELERGCLILLSTQPQAISQLRAQIRSHLRDTDRRVEVGPLPTEAMHRCLDAERLGRHLSADEKSEIVTSCGANPLILTYILKGLGATPQASVRDVIDRLGAYGGDNEAYYEERFRPLLDDPDTRKLLGLLCRIRGRTPLAWLQNWPEWSQFERLHQLHLAAFFEINIGTLSFVHNSLPAYLTRSTLPPLPGCDEAAADLAFYRDLAARYPAGSSSDPLARERLYHLVMAEDHAAALATATMDWFRGGASLFVPPDEMAALVQACYQSALAAEDRSALLRLMASAKEIDQRASAVDASKLAGYFIRLGRPERALEHIMDGTRFRVEPKEAMTFCHALFRYALAVERQDLLTKARQIFDLAKPVDLLYAAATEENRRPHDALEQLRAWADAAPNFVPLEQVLTAIVRLDTTDLLSRPQTAPALVRAILYHDVLETILERGGQDDVAPVIEAIDGTQDSDWSFYARITLIAHVQRLGQDGSKLLRDLQQAVDFGRLTEDARVLLGERLWRAGQAEEAARLISIVALPLPSAYPNNRGFGLDDFWFRLRLSRLRAVLALEPLETPPPTKPDYEAAARVAEACAALGTLWGEAVAGSLRPEDLADRFERLLTFHHRRVTFANTGRYDYYARQARQRVYEVLVDVAADIGPTGATALRTAFERVINLPGEPVLTDGQRRQMVLGLHSLAAMSADEAAAVVGAAIGDTRDEDTVERTEACFEVAVALDDLGDVDGANEWVERAGRAAHGIGNHKDYQMQTWIDWLRRSVSGGRAGSDEIQFAARVLEVAGGDGGRNAAQDLVRTCFRQNPIVGVRLGLEMVERGRLDLGGCLEAMLGAAAGMGADPGLLGPVFEQLYLLIEPHPAQNLARAIVDACQDDASASALAISAAKAARVNCLPERRIGVVRSLQDGLLARGLRMPELTNGLPPDLDDSASSSLFYKMPQGPVRTVAVVATILGDPACENDWNPFPAENKYFAWDEALSLAAPRSAVHLDALERRFVDGGRKDPSVLAALSGCAARLGDRDRAQRLATAAQELARDGGWIPWLDGAMKRKAYEALIRLDRDRWLPVARRDFENDLLQRRIANFYLLSDIGSLFDLLEWEWPVDGVFQVVLTYLRGMIEGADLPPPYASIEIEMEWWSPEAAISRLLAELYANPYVSVGSSSRAASVDYLLRGGEGLVRAYEDLDPQDTVTLERALMVVHVGASRESTLAEGFRPLVIDAARSPSLAVRGIAARICTATGWDVPAPQTFELPAIYLLLVPGENEAVRGLRLQGAEEIPGTGTGLALELYARKLRRAAQFAKVPIENLSARALQLYGDVEQTFPWTKDRGAKLPKWRSAVCASVFLRPRAHVAREAVMRALGELVAAGRLSIGGLDAYGALVPAYDVHLETERPQQRPSELNGIVSDRHTTKWEKWTTSLGMSDLAALPNRVAGRLILAEHSLFRRPDWKWPEEERVSGPAPARLLLSDITGLDELISQWHALAYDDYATGRIPDDEAIVVRNVPDEISSPAAKWVALNPVVGQRLGWRLSDEGIFKWLDAEGKVMVESVWWRDGWTDLSPPHSFVTVGEGWVVLCSEDAYAALMSRLPPARIVVGVRRAATVEDEEGGTGRIGNLLFAERPS